ncbi:MAG TPA: transcriptional regulator [Chloroflexi bacterium]|nr:transcriptional regulator [Chloroflexota bacterium]
MADLSAVPRGRSKLVYIEGEAVALFHTDEGQIYALENRCTHARGNLCEGTVHDGAVTCPLHDARFDLATGEVLSLPARRSVAAYQVKVEGDQILISRAPVERAEPARSQGASKSRQSRGDDDVDIDDELPDLDALDKALLNELQWNFPLSETPWAALAGAIGTTEQDVMARVEQLRREGIIRQVSAIFDTRKLGYKSSLVAVRVPEERIEEAAAIISSHPGVSHNYRRAHHFNIWFTLAVPPGADLDEHLARLAAAAQVEKIRKLPTLKLYKIGVKLDMNKDETALHKERGKEEKIISGEHGLPAAQRRALTERDRAFIRELQEDLPTIKRPFNPIAARLGVSTADIFAWMNEMAELGYMRRFAAILRHQRAGFTANGMAVFKVPESRIDEVGPIVAGFPQVSHCYRRPVYEDWPYNLFGMIHARSVENCEQIAADIAKEIGIDDYIILYSTEEFKKTRVRYFVDWELPEAVRAGAPSA